MEAQSKSGCKNEGEHNGSESEGSEDLDTNAMVVDSDAERGKRCRKREVMRERRTEREGG